MKDFDDAESRKTKASQAHQIWGGRFQSTPDTPTRAINESLSIDKRMWREDLQGSLAYARELARCKVLTCDQAQRIEKGLKQIGVELQEGTFPFDEALEDIHMNIEARLCALIGEDGERLHTGRSRNDQVATDLRLWQRSATDTLDEDIASLQRSLLEQSEKTIDWVMPGFTHLQSAQPVTFAHHCLAYHTMLARDRARLNDARARSAESPLGAGALAGSALPIDRHRLARALGLRHAMENSLDAVSARDFVLEFLAAAAILATHLSRLAEDIVLWASTPFAFVRLSDETSTGSSLMPQKQNPDGAELARAKAARLCGNLVALLGVVKALPLAYAKDLQEDKAALFDSFDQVRLALHALTATVAGLTPDRARMHEVAAAGFPEATDLADWLVFEHDLPFRSAHAVAGEIVRKAEACGCKTLRQIPIDEAQKIFPAVSQKLLDSLTVENALQRRNAFGASAPERVREQVARLKKNATLSETLSEIPAKG